MNLAGRKRDNLLCVMRPRNVEDLFCGHFELPMKIFLAITLSFMQEPLNFTLKLAVLKFSRILSLIYNYLLL